MQPPAPPAAQRQTLLALATAPVAFLAAVLHGRGCYVQAFLSACVAASLLAVLLPSRRCITPSTGTGTSGTSNGSIINGKSSELIEENDDNTICTIFSARYSSRTRVGVSQGVVLAATLPIIVAGALALRLDSLLALHQGQYSTHTGGKLGATVLFNSPYDVLASTRDYMFVFLTWTCLVEIRQVARLIVIYVSMGAASEDGHEKRTPEQRELDEDSHGKLVDARLRRLLLFNLPWIAVVFVIPAVVLAVAEYTPLEIPETAIEFLDTYLYPSNGGVRNVLVALDSDYFLVNTSPLLTLVVIVSNDQLTNSVLSLFERSFSYGEAHIVSTLLQFSLIHLILEFTSRLATKFRSGAHSNPVDDQFEFHYNLTDFKSTTAVMRWAQIAAKTALHKWFVLDTPLEHVLSNIERTSHLLDAPKIKSEHKMNNEEDTKSKTNEDISTTMSEVQAIDHLIKKIVASSSSESALTIESVTTAAATSTTTMDNKPSESKDSLNSSGSLHTPSYFLGGYYTNERLATNPDFVSKVRNIFMINNGNKNKNEVENEGFTTVVNVDSNSNDAKITKEINTVDEEYVTASVNSYIANMETGSMGNGGTLTGEMASFTLTYLYDGIFSNVILASLILCIIAIGVVNGSLLKRLNLVNNEISDLVGGVLLDKVSCTKTKTQSINDSDKPSRLRQRNQNINNVKESKTDPVKKIDEKLESEEEHDLISKDYQEEYERKEQIFAELMKERTSLSERFYMISLVTVVAILYPLLYFLVDFKRDPLVWILNFVFLPGGGRLEWVIARNIMIVYWLAIIIVGVWFAFTRFPERPVVVARTPRELSRVNSDDESFFSTKKNGINPKELTDSLKTVQKEKLSITSPSSNSDNTNKFKKNKKTKLTVTLDKYVEQVKFEYLDERKKQLLSLTTLYPKLLTNRIPGTFGTTTAKTLIDSGTPESQTGTDDVIPSGIKKGKVVNSGTRVTEVADGKEPLTGSAMSATNDTNLTDPDQEIRKIAQDLTSQIESIELYIRIRAETESKEYGATNPQPIVASTDHSPNGGTTTSTTTRSNQLNYRRKYFHLLASLMFIPAYSTFKENRFMGVAFSVALFLMCVVEFIRFFRMPPLGEEINFFYRTFLDNRLDQGRIIFSHIYLLVGCALPIWLNEIVVDNDVVGSGMATTVAGLTGVLTLGIGDSMASIVGKKWGRHKWAKGNNKSLEGTLAFNVSVILSVALVVFVFEQHWTTSEIILTHTNNNNIGTKLVEDPSMAWNMICGSTVFVAQSILEALSDQNDNLIIPLHGFALMSLCA